MINVTIDGVKVEVPEGTTVLRAAEAAGITIPTLCDHKHLSPYGGCRLCLVEVEGARGLQPSCTLPASNGMNVLTNTPKVREARKFVLTLIFSERNHFCMYCPVSGGDCELQNSAYGEGMTHWPLPPNWQPFPIDASHKDFVLDNNRCILCRRCIRACGELVGNYTLGVEERGARTMLMADLGVPLGESTCISCGVCLQVCPTGALIDRQSAYMGREKDVQHIKTTCPGCSVGCGVELIVRDNRLLRIEGDWAAPVNEGLLCELGRFTPLKDERERIVTPLVRKNGALKAATWDEALAVIADNLKPLAGRDGSGVAALASTRLTSEALSAFEQLFGRKLGSEMMASTEETPVGRTSDLSSLDALKTADCVVTIGADLIAQHQVAGFFVKRALPKGTKLIVIDGENPPTGGLRPAMGPLANVVLQPTKGSEYDLVMGIVAALTGNDNSTALETVSQKTGIAVETIAAAIQHLAAAQKPAIVYGNSVMGGESGRMLKALSELAHAASNAALIGAQGQVNGMAAQAYGLNKTFETKGRRAVYLALGDEIPSQRLIQKLEGAPFVAVQASYVSPATAMANVVLPVEMWAEQEGHYVNLEGRVQEAHRGLTPSDEVWANAKALRAIAEKMGFALDANWQSN